MKSSYISKHCIHVYMLAPLHSVIDREEHEKYLFLPLYENTENSLCPQDQLVTVKGQSPFDSNVVQHFTEHFQQKGSVLHITKSSMKPRSGTTTNCHLQGSGERNGEQW